MSVPGPKGYALNRTRNAYLATRVRLAATHWSRFRGLMATDADRFPAGEGLWIVPCHGVHTFAMRFPIDVVYLDSEKSCRPHRRESETLATGSGSHAGRLST